MTVERTPFSHHQKVVKLVTLGIVGLVVLLGSPRVTSAIGKTRPGRTYCDCACKGTESGNTTELMWEKVRSCAVNGKACKRRQSDGTVEAGTLQNCQQCKGDSSGSGFSDCNPAKAAAGVRGDKPPAVQGEKPPAPARPDAAPKPGGVMVE
jgi:hypothetical protein